MYLIANQITYKLKHIHNIKQTICMFVKYVIIMHYATLHPMLFITTHYELFAALM